MMFRSSLLALLASTAIGGDCFIPRKSFSSSTVLVPATVGGHTNMLVEVPNAIAFSQLYAVVPAAAYQPMQYQAEPAGKGLAQPQPNRDALAEALNAINKRLNALEGHTEARGDSAESLDARVAAIFQQSCVACHSTQSMKGGLRLFDENNQVPKLPRHSILARVKSHDAAKRMPKGGPPLSEEQISDLEKWGALPPDAAW